MQQKLHFQKHLGWSFLRVWVGCGRPLSIRAFQNQAMSSTIDQTGGGDGRVRTLLVVMLCYLFYYTGRQNFGFAIPGMQEELGLSKAELGWCGAAMLWSYALGQAVNGAVADRVGGRVLMGLGGVLSFGCNLLVSVAGGLAGVLVPWALNGLAQSMGWAPGSRILSNWWGRSHRGRVYGWYVFAAGSSSVLTFAMAAWVVGWGWRWIFRGPVCLMLVGCLVCWLLVRDRPPDARVDDGGGQVQVGGEDRLGWWARYRAGLTCPPFLVACAAIGFQNLARYGLLIWVPVHFLGSDWKDSAHRWLAVALPLGMAVGAVTAGWVSDRLFAGGRARPVVWFLLLAAVCSGGLALLPGGSVWVLPLMFLTGFFVYGPQSAFWALCPDLLGGRNAGTGTGMMNFCAYFLAGVGEPLIGGLIDARQSTHVVFVVVGVACLAGAALMFLIRKKA